VVESPREAFEFVARHHPGLDPAALAARYEQLLLALMPEMEPR
jgi:hypothetical protein